MNHQLSGSSGNESPRRSPPERDDPRSLLGRRIPANGGYPLTTTFVICLNYERFTEFCHQEGLNPRARLLKPITRVGDTYKVQGHLNFDLIFLTDSEDIPMFDILYSEVMTRFGHGTSGNIYYLHT